MAMTNYECKKSSQNAKMAMGKCIYCGKTEPMYGTKYCPDCAEKELEANSRYYYNNKKQFLERNKKNRTKLRLEAKSKGMCQCCYKYPSHKEGSYYCKDCKSKIMKKTHEKNNRSVNLKYIWKLEGKCGICGSERYLDKKVCEKCYTSLIKNIEMARSKRDIKKMFWNKLNMQKI